MPHRYDAWVLFEDKIDITELEAFIRAKRKEEFPDLTMYHVVFAAIVRTFAEVPELNRFVVNSKVYSRNEIKGSMVVMKGMRRDSERSMIMPRFQLEDTLADVVRRIEEETSQIDTTVSKRLLPQLFQHIPFSALQFFLKNTLSQRVALSFSPTSSITSP